MRGNLVEVSRELAAGDLRRPALHALEAVVFVLSLIIVWLGLTRAHGA